jgi:hypothetical protein
MTFDPYHQWLGIQPAEQPPNHYRLLGLAPFEDQPHVIESAADRQIAHLRSLATGPHAALAQRLLGEVMAAKVCLLQASPRAAYDAELRQRLALAPAMSSATMGRSATILLEPAAQPTVDEGQVRRHHRQAQRALLPALFAVGLLMAATIAVWKSGAIDRLISRAPPPESVDRRLADAPTIPVESPPATPPATPPAMQPETPPPAQPAAVEPEPVAPLGPPTEPANPSPQPAPAEPSPAAPAPSEPPVETPPPPKHPVPSLDEQAAVLRIINEAYELGKERSADEKLKLASDMMTQADRSGEQYVERFALLRKASELASEAGDPAAMLQPVDAMALDFEVDAVKAKAKLLARFAEGALDLARLTAVVEASRDFCVEAIGVDRVDEAVLVAQAVNQATARPAGKTLKKEAADRVNHLAQWQDGHQRAELALKRLADAPDDSVANLVAGRWLCFVRDHWSEGLPYLAIGSDSELGDLASRELGPQPSTPDDQVKLADAWYELAQNRTGEDREGLLRRAGHWYAKAKPALGGGLVLSKVDKRLGEIEKLGPSLLDHIAGRTERPTSLDPIAVGVWVDLMPRIDIARDAVHGAWKQQAELLSVPADDFARLMLPVRLAQAEYDLEFEITRTDGNDAIGFVLPVADRQVALVLSSGNGTVSGLEMVQGRAATHNRNPTRVTGALLNGRRHTVRISVRHKGQNSVIDVAFNGRPLLRGAGDVNQLVLPREWRVSATDRPAVGANKSSLTIRRARLRLVSGEATPVTKQTEPAFAPGFPAAAPPGPPAAAPEQPRRGNRNGTTEPPPASGVFQVP